MPRIAYGRNKTQVDLLTYPDNSNYPIGTGEWNEDPEDGGLLGFTKQSATLSSNTFTPTATMVEITGETTTDDIDSIGTTNTNEFDLLYILSASGQTLTLKHENNSGNSGEIVLLGTVDKAVSTTVPTILIRKGTKWYEWGGGITNTLNDVGDVTVSSASSGDILKWNGSAWINIAKGTAGQALKVNSGGTDLEWGDVSSSLSTLSIDTDKSWGLNTISDLFIEPVNVSGSESKTVTTEVYAIGSVTIGGSATLTVSGSGEVNLI
jgi:hypothetical protein